MKVIAPSHHLVKVALNRLTKHIMAKGGPKAQAAAISALPKAVRGKQAYKALGRQAAGTVSRMSDAAGHGRSHIFSVTRNAQQFTQGMPEQVRRRATLGSLLHDVGREAEGRVKKRIGKPAFKRTPSAWHSELGGRYSKDFLRKNRQTAQHVPGLSRGRLSGTVRGHDTDIHAVKPWTEKVLGRDPAASATYLADKAEGMGRVGAERTVQMAKKFKETPAETWGVAQKNVSKYDRAIKQRANPQQAQMLRPRVREYEDTMRRYRDTGTLAPPQQVKAAMAPSDFRRILKQKKLNKISYRAMRNLAARTKSTAQGDILTALYQLPAAGRAKKIKDVGEKIRYILGRSSR